MLRNGRLPESYSPPDTDDEVIPKATHPGEPVRNTAIGRNAKVLSGMTDTMGQPWKVMNICPMPGLLYELRLIVCCDQAVTKTGEYE